QTLSRSYISSGGQVARHDDYFSFTNLPYGLSPYIGTVNVNYYTTILGYNARGLADREQRPTGTITRTVYDNLDRVASVWVGTNDTPPSGDWSPTNNNAPAN